MGAKTDKAKGRTKQAVGSMTGDEKMKREGRVDEDAGRAKEKAQNVIDAVRDKVKGVTDPH
jgi:uncharacterized protein YjbJ (UPF0337 family)